MADTPKRGRGRPAFQVDAAQLKQLKLLAGYGLTLNELAGFLGINPSTLDDLIKRDPNIKGAIEKGRSEAAGQVAQSLFNNAVRKNNVTAQIFWLKTRLRWREADRRDDDGEDAPSIRIGYQPRQPRKGDDERAGPGPDDEPGGPELGEEPSGDEDEAS